MRLREGKEDNNKKDIGSAEHSSISDVFIFYMGTITALSSISGSSDGMRTRWT